MSYLIISDKVFFQTVHTGRGDLWWHIKRLLTKISSTFDKDGTSFRLNPDKVFELRNCMAPNLSKQGGDETLPTYVL